ncbi:MAG: ETC complex I subunit [Hansschlegelia sp.]
MAARIFKPARTAMQSGVAKTKRWVLEHELSEARRIEPLMGWTSSGDTRQQVRLFFATREEAIAYATREGLAYRVEEPKPVAPRVMAYADNFRAGLPEPWTH